LRSGRTNGNGAFSRLPGVEPVFPGEKTKATRGQPSHRIGLNAVLLHRGHLPAVSNKTALVKCFMYRHALHFHRIERVSCGCSIWSNAFDAISRIFSRAAFSGLSGESITSTPVVEVCQQICAICAPKDEVRAFSCSHEHIRAQVTLSRIKNTLRNTQG
jgi:hypothetical protein